MCGVWGGVCGVCVARVQGPLGGLEPGAGRTGRQGWKCRGSGKRRLLWAGGGRRRACVRACVCACVGRGCRAELESSSAGWTPGLTSGTGAGRKCCMEKPGRCQNFYLTRTGKVTPPPPLPGPSWGFKKHVRGSETAAVPTEPLGAGQQSKILICLGILFLCLAGGAGREACVSPFSWV